MPEQKEKIEQMPFGVRLSDLNEARLVDIESICRGIYGSKREDSEIKNQLEGLNEQIVNFGFKEFEINTPRGPVKIYCHAKNLPIGKEKRIVAFSSAPNFHLHGALEKALQRGLADRFSKEVSSYLEHSGVGIPLEAL